MKDLKKELKSDIAAEEAEALQLEKPKISTAGNISAVKITNNLCSDYAPESK